MPRKFKALLAALGVLGLGAIAIVLWIVFPQPRSAASDPVPAAALSKGGFDPGGFQPDPAGGDQSPYSKALYQQIADVENRLVAASGLDDARRLLVDLATKLDAAKPVDAVAAIEAYLRSGRDARTGLDFLVSLEGGTLEESPTLRGWLLDLFGSLDPASAASQARVQLSGRLSLNGGESALAMRNLVWGSGQPMSGVDRQIFERATLEHVSNAQWASRSEAGYLEGFDAAVFSQTPSSTARLAAIASDGAMPAASRFAAVLALERIAQTNHPDSLAAIASSRLDPASKGSLLARADLSVPGAARVVEDFLSLSDANGVEAQKSFWGAFPLASRTQGPRLISRDEMPPNESQMVRDRRALDLLEQWLREGRIPRHSSSIQKARDRLKACFGD